MVDSIINTSEVSLVKVLFTKPKGNDSPFDIVYISKPDVIYSESSDSSQTSTKDLSMLQEEIALQQAVSDVKKAPVKKSIPASTVSEEQPLLSEAIEMYSPKVVGSGVKDWGTVGQQMNQIFVAVKWSQFAEGVAIRFKLPPKSANESSEMLKFDIRTVYDSRPEIRMRVMSESGISIYQDDKWRPKITANWREYGFKVSGYPDDESILGGDNPIPRFVEILVRKPIIKTVPDHELILVRNLHLVEVDSPLEMIADTMEMMLKFSQSYG